MVTSGTRASSPLSEGADSCWICFQEDGELGQPCECPRSVHRDCLAYWQLHSAGTAEETSCRFCSSHLPDWKLTLAGGSSVEAQVPVVAALFAGCEWRLRVAPTPEGRLRFQRQIELITGLPFEEQAHIRFYCKTPNGQDISLSGTRCLEAAIHCAAIHCAQQKELEEQHQQHQQQQQQQHQQQQQQHQKQQPTRQTNQHAWQLHSQEPRLVSAGRHTVQVSLPLGSSSQGFVAVLQRLQGLIKLAFFKKRPLLPAG